MEVVVLFRRAAFAVVLTGILVGLSGERLTEVSPARPVVEMPATPTEGARPVPSEPPPDRMVTLAFAGDLVGHVPLVRAAAVAGGGYDFTPTFAWLRPAVATADLAVVNLETTLAGDGWRYSGYPRFNSPDAYADALAWAGFDVVGHANNHALDRGPAGTARTRQVLERAGLSVVGTSPGDARPWTVLDVSGVPVGIAAYTYGTNGLPLPSDDPDLVALLDPARVRADLAAMRRAGAAMVVVLVHWGAEYRTAPTVDQQAWAADLIGWGADVVVGSHPHVIQPVARVTAGGRHGLVAYSLGNLASTQTGGGRDHGLLLTVTAHLDADGTVTLDPPTSDTVWVRRTTVAGRRAYQLLPARAVFDSRVVPIPPLTDAEMSRLTDALAATAAIVGAAPGPARSSGS